MHHIQIKNPAEMYDTYFVPSMFLPWATVMLHHAKPKPGERVLDVACGTGVVAIQAASAVGKEGQVVGLDINPAMLAVARSHPKPPGAVIIWEEGDAMSLPFLDESFDIVFCQQGLQLFQDRQRAVNEMRRVLVPGGRAFVIVWQKLTRHPAFEALFEALARRFSIPLSELAVPFSLSETDELEGLFANAGFSNVRIITESISIRFPHPDQFVSLSVVSAAAAVPAFSRMQGSEQDAVLTQVREEVDPILRRFYNGDSIAFPMFTNIVEAIS